jgi:hypothetical protein
MADGDTMQEVWAKIVRREGYFRAVIIQSRGNVAGRCSQKCNNPRVTRRFESCVRLDGFCGGACAECVWQSHGRLCGHHDDNQPSTSSDDSDDSDDESGSDDEGGSDMEVKEEPAVIDPWRNAQVIGSDSE